jgi:hypothetical protein
MMSDRKNVLRRLLSVFAAAVLMAAATGAVAQADNYGEIGHPFGERGTGPGQFTSVPGYVNAFGVDPTDNNSVYVADNPKKNEYRIQKFSPNAKGEYEFVASASIKPLIPAKAAAQDSIEGVAVDPSLKRIYVLANEERPEEEEEEAGEEEPHRVDGNVHAASTLYAFSTVANGETLEPANGTTGGVLAGPSVLKPQSETPGEALLEPSGITVDPTTHEVIILGEEDPGEVGGEPQPLIALQRVTEKGKLGVRYVDTKNFFEGEGSNVPLVASPVVTSSGKVYVEAQETNDQIDEIPANFTEKVSPTVLTELDGEKDALTSFPGQPPSSKGAGLSIGPEGTIYAYAGIQLQTVSGEHSKYPGALAFNANGVEEGWTGGQSEATGNGKCTISFFGTPAVAAGKEHTLFVYDSNPSDPRVLEFGPDGTGCPQASATAPSATVNGVSVSESTPIPIGDKVTLSSTLTQGNAKSVEWEFGDGTKETVSAEEYEQTEVTHQFTASGDLTVTEKIHTDDLATPEVVEHSKINIEAAPPAVVTGEAEQVEGATATLAGTVNPNGGTLSECYFEYGKTESYGSKANCASLPKPGDNPVPVSASIAGLSEHTTYHFRVVATNATETSKGSDRTFTTGPKAVVQTGAASSITQSGATLNATVNPEGAAVTSCVFDYGTTTSYGQEARCASTPGSGSSPVPVSAVLPGLSASTTYHFRILAGTMSGTSDGEDMTLTTEAAQKLEGPPQEEIPGAGAKKQQEEAAAAAAALAKKQQEEAVAAAKAKAEAEAAAKKKQEEAAKPPTRAQQLTKALGQCKKDKPKSKRAKCEATAKKKYGPKKKKKTKKKK